MLRSLCIILLLSTRTIGFSQVADSTQLFREMNRLDSILFEEGFNRCQLEQVELLLSEDFEFYHDQNGIQDKGEFLKGFEESICADPERKPIRILKDGSDEVFPLYGKGILYGAIHKGIHEFYIRESGKELYKTSIAPFTSLWVKEAGEWKLKRVLSYDHRSPDHE